MNALFSRKTTQAISPLPFVFLGLLTLFCVLASLVASGTTLAFDSAVLLWVNERANPSYDAFFVAVTELGGVIVVSAVTLFLFVYFLAKKRYSRAILVALGIGGAAAMGHIVKAIIERSRPDLWDWLVVETNFSFPSGHAIGCSALALCIVVLLWRTKWRTVAIAGAIVYVLMVSLSRLYVGVHYPSDILGGWLLSGAWIALVASCIQIYHLDNAKKKLV